MRSRKRTPKPSTGYALRRGHHWVVAPKGDCLPGQPIPPALTLSTSPEHAWLSSTIDQALERSTLLRMCWGCSTEIQRIK